MISDGTTTYICDSINNRLVYAQNTFVNNNM